MSIEHCKFRVFEKMRLDRKNKKKGIALLIDFSSAYNRVVMSRLTKLVK